MGGGVVYAPGEPEPERLRRSLGRGTVELLLQVGQERGLRGLKPGRVSGLAQGPVQLVVREAAHVVQV